MLLLKCKANVRKNVMQFPLSSDYYRVQEKDPFQRDRILIHQITELSI